MSLSRITESGRRAAGMPGVSDVVSSKDAFDDRSCGQSVLQVTGRSLQSPPLRVRACGPWGSTIRYVRFFRQRTHRGCDRQPISSPRPLVRLRSTLDTRRPHAWPLRQRSSTVAGASVSARTDGSSRTWIDAFPSRRRQGQSGLVPFIWTGRSQCFGASAVQGDCKAASDDGDGFWHHTTRWRTKCIASRGAARQRGGIEVSSNVGLAGDGCAGLAATWRTTGLPPQRQPTKRSPVFRACSSRQRRAAPWRY
jgi:hypothetical protein